MCWYTQQFDKEMQWEAVRTSGTQGKLHSAAIRQMFKSQVASMSSGHGYSKHDGVYIWDTKWKSEQVP